jgi:hypothetical protein
VETLADTHLAFCDVPWEYGNKARGVHSGLSHYVLGVLPCTPQSDNGKPRHGEHDLIPMSTHQIPGDKEQQRRSSINNLIFSRREEDEHCKLCQFAKVFLKLLTWSRESLRLGIAFLPACAAFHSH